MAGCHATVDPFPFFHDSAAARDLLRGQNVGDMDHHAMLSPIEPLKSE
jgi:hypothetical protein